MAFIVQSWSQEKNFKRPYFVRVPEIRVSEIDEPGVDEPEGTDAGKLPVFIFLHGIGGDAKEAKRGFIRGRGKIASRYIMVFPQGHLESWNIVSERSKADALAAKQPPRRVNHRQRQS